MSCYLNLYWVVECFLWLKEMTNVEDTSASKLSEISVLVQHQGAVCEVFCSAEREGDEGNKEEATLLKYLNIEQTAVYMWTKNQA